MTAPVRIEGAGGAVLVDGVGGEATEGAGALGVVMTGAAVVVGRTGGNGVLGGGVLGAVTGGGGGDVCQ